MKKSGKKSAKLLILFLHLDWLIPERIPLRPHNIICVQDLLRFLASICDPYENQNTDVMIQISLSLLTVALEVGARSIPKYQSLLIIIKDALCRNLLSVCETGDDSR